MNELTTIKRSAFQANLLVAKSYLEDNNIFCVIHDEAQVYTAVVAEGALLQVKEKDAVRAIELLIEGGFATEEEYK